MNLFEEIVSELVDLCSGLNLTSIALNLVMASMFFYVIEVMFKGGI